MVDFWDLTMNNGMWVRLNMRYILKNGSTFDWTYDDTDHQMCGSPIFRQIHIIFRPRISYINDIFSYSFDVILRHLVPVLTGTK